MQPRVRTGVLGYLLRSEPPGSFLKARAGGIDLLPTPCPASPSHSWFIGQTLSASLRNVNTTRPCGMACKCPGSSEWHAPAGAPIPSIHLSRLSTTSLLGRFQMAFYFSNIRVSVATLAPDVSKGSRVKRMEIPKGMHTCTRTYTHACTHARAYAHIKTSSMNQS